MHCAAGLDDATSGRVFLGDVELTALKEKHLTELRRDRIGFVFQAFNLVPTLTARRTSRCRSAIAGRAPDRAWFDEVIDTVGLRDRLGAPAERAVRRPAAAGGLRPRARGPARRRLRRRADRQPGLDVGCRGARLPAPGRRHARADRRHGHPRPGRRGWTDRVVFLADGRVVDELRAPTPERVLDGDGRGSTSPPEPDPVLRATWRSLFARKLRLFLSAFAVILGVAFVSGSLRLHRHPRAGLHRVDQRSGGRRHRAAGHVGRQRRRVRWRDLRGAHRAGVPGRAAGRRAGAERADGRVTSFGTSSSARTAR